MRKFRRVYDLYQGPQGPTADSKWYDLTNKVIYTVAAYSGRQAVYLAANGVWYDGANRVGLLAYKHSDDDYRGGKCVDRWDGTVAESSGYKHYQVFKDWGRANGDDARTGTQLTSE